MIYLIDRVLPESFFANNLRALFVDMAVFRELMRSHLPRLSRHLDRLRATSPSDKDSGKCPSPPGRPERVRGYVTLGTSRYNEITLEGKQILI